MKLSEALAVSKQQLKDSDIPSYQIDSLILLCHCLNLSKEQVVFNPHTIINQEQVDDFFSLIERRINKEPISHIIGKREFFGSDFIVNSKVLDPRPDSETLIEIILSLFDDKESSLKILELGVGSGCLILTTLNIFKNSSAIGVDVQKDALDIASKNSELLNVQNRINFIESNWFDKINDKQKFDLIISNPPYIKTSDINNLQAEVKNYEPKIALDGGDDGLDCYRQIAKQAINFLKKDAILIVEIGQGQEDQINDIFYRSGLNPTGNKKDLGGIIRCLIFKNEDI